MAALFVQLHQDYGEWREVFEGRHHGVRNDLVAINRPLAADLNPLPFQGRAPRAGRAGRAAQKAARAAFFDHQSVFAGCLKIAAIFAIIVGDAQDRSPVFIISHIDYFLMMRALPTAGVPHPIFMLISASFT